MEAAHAWVFVVKLVGMRENIYIFTKLFLTIFPDDILKSSHASTKTEIMWREEKIVVPYLSIYALFATL